MRRRSFAWTTIMVCALLQGSICLAGELAIRGRVLTAGALPAPEVVVSAIRSESSYDTTLARLSGERPGTLSARTLTRDDGTFELQISEAGIYRIVIEAEGHLPLQSELGPTVSSRNLPDATLVADEGLLVRVVDEAGDAIEGALVTLGPSQSRARRFSFYDAKWSAPHRSALSDAEGIVFLPRARASRESLAVHAPGREAFVRSRLGGGDIEVTLAQATERTILVADASGAPVPDAIVLLGSARTPVGLSDDQGLAGIPLQRGAAADVRVLASDGRGAKALVDWSGSDEPPAPRVIALPETALVAGRVIDSETGRPVPGALVSSGRKGGHALSGRGGAFEIESGGASELMLLAQAPGYLPARPYEYPVNSADFDPTLALSPAASVEGVVRNEAGEPLAGVKVNLEEKRGASGMMRIEISSGGAREAQGLSDSQGRFIIEGIDPGKSWTLVAERDGLVSTKQDLPVLAARGHESGLELTMKSGLSARGRVTDEEGRPLRGAEVSLSPAKPEGAHGMMMIQMGGGATGSSALTDAEGRFVVGGLEEGPHELKITREGYARHEAAGIELSTETPLAELGDFQLAIGEILQGLVVDEGGLPIEGVAVSRSQGGGLAWFGPGAEVAEPDAITGPDGWFSLDGLAEGETLSLSLKREGYVDGKAPQLVVPLVEPLTVTLDPSSTVSGVVLNPEGQPVPGASVTLNRTVSATMGNNQITMMTGENSEADRDGAFAFEGLPPGEISLEASAPGFKHMTRALTVERGSDLDGVEMPLEPGAVVRGRVLNSDGSPAVGAEVSPVGDTSRFDRGAGAPSAVADGEGRYVLDGVAEGALAIEARNESGMRTVRELEARAGLNDLDLRFEGGQRVAGVVTDPAGAPIAGAIVSLQPAGRFWGGPELRSGSNGSFEFEGISDGDYSALATHDEHAVSERVAVTVAGQDVNELSLALREGSALEGQVVGLSPERLAKVSIDAFAVGGGGYAEARAGSDGRFRLEGLAPGEWEIRGAIEGGGPRASVRARVEAGGASPPVELVFEGGYTLAGRAMQDGRALTGVSIYASGENVDAGGWAETDASGRFSIEGLEAGQYELTLRQWETGLSHTETLEVRGDEQVTIDVPTARIAGRVVDAGDGGPVSGVRVALERADAPGSGSSLFGMGGTSDLDGGFQIVPVTDGDYRLVATKEGYATATTSVSISGGRSLDDVEIEIESSEGLSLQVTLASGGFPDEINYALVDPAGVPLSSGRHGTGEGGLVRLTKVPAGTWELVLSGGGSGSLALDVQAPGGPLAVTLPKSTSLQVRVNELAESGGLARVQVYDQRGRLFRAARWYGQPQSEWELRSGSALIGQLPAGAYEVVVTSPDGRTWKGSATTSEASTAQLVLD